MTPSKGGALIIDLCSYIERRRPPVAPADRTLSTAERMIELARHVVDASISKKSGTPQLTHYLTRAYRRAS